MDQINNLSVFQNWQNQISLKNKSLKQFPKSQCHKLLDGY